MLLNINRNNTGKGRVIKLMKKKTDENIEPHHLIIKSFARTRSLGNDMDWNSTYTQSSHLARIACYGIECVYWNGRCPKTYPFW